MATYVIGDVQGCYVELKNLLSLINFSPARDILWFTGDLVNRGPQSLDVLRFVKSLGERHITVLGNHDLHLLAAAYGVDRISKGDTLEAILTAHDKDSLIDWLRRRPLIHVDDKWKVVLVHAGLAPCWPVPEATNLAHEVESVLRGESPDVFLRNMYGNQPDQWQEELEGIERLRCIVNYFTRMRFCHLDGRLELTYKGEIASKPADLTPWFDVSHRVNAEINIIFGHWAALNGKVDLPHLFPLDTGCVWGNRLTALRLDDYQRFEVPSVVAPSNFLSH